MSFRLVLLPALFYLLWSSAAISQVAVDTPEISSVIVIGTTPLSSTGIDTKKYPGNVQSMTLDDIENDNSLDISDSLIKRIGSISVNTAQSNPYQNDIFYRGFLASPLVGATIGLSIYLDGVRINEGFSDTLNWDLIPDSALSVVNVIPGSNPLYGLNTLGGALVLNSKSGELFQGTEFGLSSGSFGRSAVELEHGGVHDSFHWYLTADYDDESGWRDLSPSRVKRLFGKLGWNNDATDIDFSYIFGDTDLIGNGFAPDRLLALDREASHTWPDQTENRLDHINIQLTHDATDKLQLASNMFYRHYRRTTLNGDAETECVAERGGQEIGIFLNAEGEDGVSANRCSGDPTAFFDENGNQLLATDGLTLEAGGEERRSWTETETYGGTFQSTLFENIFGYNNQLTAGLDFSQVDSSFIQSEAEAGLERHGNIIFTTDPEDQEIEVNIETEHKNIGVFITDVVDLTKALAVTLSGRYQYAQIEILDRTGEVENQDLNGKHSFNRFNPAVGASYQLNPALIFYGSYAEGFRVPTAAELTCADEDDPCNLPNAFVADPPLNPVIGRTVEIGARGSVFWLDLIGPMNWDITYFRTALDNDLLFVRTQTGGGGFFQNIDETLRQGIELSLVGGQNRFNYFINYAYIEATFEDDLILSSVINADGEHVQSGDSIPGIPGHTFKVGAEYEWVDNFWLGGDLLASSGSHLRTDESNSLPKTAGYMVLNLNMRYVFKRFNFELWGKVNNVLDREYETGATRNFNANAELFFGDDIEVERFSAPGTPFGAFVGIKFKF